MSEWVGEFKTPLSPGILVKTLHLSVGVKFEGDDVKYIELKRKQDSPKPKKVLIHPDINNGSNYNLPATGSILIVVNFESATELFH